MRDKILKILGKYKVIGDTTYGLGFQDANDLAGELEDLIFDENIKVEMNESMKRYEQAKEDGTLDTHFPKITNF